LRVDESIIDGEKGEECVRILVALLAGFGCVCVRRSSAFVWTSARFWEAETEHFDFFGDEGGGGGDD